MEGCWVQLVHLKAYSVAEFVPAVSLKGSLRKTVSKPLGIRNTSLGSAFCHMEIKADFGLWSIKVWLWPQTQARDSFKVCEIVEFANMWIKLVTLQRYKFVLNRSQREFWFKERNGVFLREKIDGMGWQSWPEETIEPTMPEMTGLFLESDIRKCKAGRRDCQGSSFKSCIPNSFENCSSSSYPINLDPSSKAWDLLDKNVSFLKGKSSC